MNLGIAIRHVKNTSGEDRELRSDVVAFVGVIVPGRWPTRAAPGDFVELPLDGLDMFETHPTRGFFDPATQAAVRGFFQNGGRSCIIYGLCVTGSRDLVDRARLEEVTKGLLERLREEEEPALLVVPPLAYLPVTGHGSQQVYAGHHAVCLFMRHCREMCHRFMIIDAPRHTGEAALIQWIRQIRDEADVDPSYGAVYFPWLCDGDTKIPPSGIVAGVYARVEGDSPPFGVRVAPANVLVRGVSHAEVAVSWRDSAELVQQGINPILAEPGRGLMVWGARTLSEDPKWQQVTSRRIVSFVTERIRRDAEWVVFEHQRPELWETVTRMVSSRLDGYWNAGLLTGESAGSDYLVQCDEELNPPKVRDAGQIHFRVVLRPISATEFIEVELQLGQ